jgi:hypothetical protein
VAARPVSVRLADAVAEAIVEHYTGPVSGDRRVLLLLTTRPPLAPALNAAADRRVAVRPPGAG